MAASYRPNLPRVLVITSEWPTPNRPEIAPFLVREVQALRRAGVAVEVFAFRGAMNPGNYLRAWGRLLPRLNRARYDLVHAQFGQSGLLALFPKRLPLVVTYQGSDLNGLYGEGGQMTAAGFLLRMVSRLVAWRADEIILVSRQLAGHLPRRRAAGWQRVHVIPGGVDLSVFRPMPKALARKKLGLAMDRRLVLFAGGKSNPIKRYALAQDAVARLPQSLKAELFVVNGVPPESMPLYLCAADVLLLTSIREGSPNVVKEALACNLPVVSVNVGDVHERLQGLPGCYLCPEDDADTIARGLQQVLESEQRFQGRQAVIEMSLENTAEKILQVYLAVLSR